jgi:hypothetical protein
MWRDRWSFRTAKTQSGLCEILSVSADAQFHALAPCCYADDRPCSNMRAGRRGGTQPKPAERGEDERNDPEKRTRQSRPPGHQSR